MHWVYILRCADDSLYVGQTCSDPSDRETYHNEGRGARYTAQRRPVHLVYFEHHDSIVDAIAREHQLKRWSARKKEALIAGNRASLKSLSKCRSRWG